MLNAYVYTMPQAGRFGYINSYIVAVYGNVQTETEIRTKYGVDVQFSTDYVDFRDSYSYCKNYGQVLVMQEIKKDILRRFEGEDIIFHFEPCFYMIVECYGKKAPHMFLGTMHK